MPREACGFGPFPPRIMQRSPGGPRIREILRAEGWQVPDASGIRQNRFPVMVVSVSR